MGGVPVLLMVAALGVDFGWIPDDGGGVQYIIQVGPEKLADVRRAGEIVSTIPPEVRGHVSKVVIRLGEGPLPREMPRRTSRKTGYGAIDARDDLNQDERDHLAMPIPALPPGEAQPAGKTVRPIPGPETDRVSRRLMKPAPNPQGGFTLPGFGSPAASTQSAPSTRSRSSATGGSTSGIVAPPSPGVSPMATSRAGGPSTAPSNQFGTTPGNAWRSEYDQSLPPSTRSAADTPNPFRAAASQSPNGAGASRAGSGSASSFGQLPAGFGDGSGRSSGSNAQPDPVRSDPNRSGRSEYTFRNFDEVYGPPYDPTGGAFRNQGSTIDGGNGDRYDTRSSADAARSTDFDGGSRTNNAAPPFASTTTSVSQTWNRLDPKDVAYLRDQGWTPELYERFRLGGGNFYKATIPIDEDRFPISADGRRVKQQVPFEIDRGLATTTGVPSYDQRDATANGRYSQPGDSRFVDGRRDSTATDPRYGDSRYADGSSARSPNNGDPRSAIDQQSSAVDPRREDRSSVDRDWRREETRSNGWPRVPSLDRYGYDDELADRPIRRASLSDARLTEEELRIERLREEEARLDARYRARLREEEQLRLAAAERDERRAAGSAGAVSSASDLGKGGTAASQATDVGQSASSGQQGGDLRERKSITNQPMFGTFFILSILANFYLVYWLKGLREQFRETVATRRAAASTIVSDG